MLEKKFYKGREHTFVKHYVLERYLERLAFKIGMSIAGATLNYVDGFSGPWQEKDDQLQDTSPFIAIEKLRRTRAQLAARNRQFNFRCLFIEREPEPFQRLRAAAAAVTDAEIRTLQGEFENLVPQAAAFASEGRNPFGFFFVDPTGWTGYPMSKLQPLFSYRYSELLINFMTSFIDRFVDSENPSLLEGFRDLFGDERYRNEWTGLVGLDKEDAIVGTYCRRLKQAGEYTFVGSSVVLDPNSDRTYYHLVYATHHPEGMRSLEKWSQKLILSRKLFAPKSPKRSVLPKKEWGISLTPMFLQAATTFCCCSDTTKRPRPQYGVVWSRTAGFYTTMPKNLLFHSLVLLCPI